MSTITKSAPVVTTVSTTMHALVFEGANQKAWREVPVPVLIDPTDVIVRVEATTICGSDLHILKGDVPEVTVGRVLGHEAVGTVVSTGLSVARVKVGDRVLVSCITSCGSCRYCRESRYGQCLGGGGWILGHLIDGTQAEYVRVPFADNSTYAAPAGVPAVELLMLADILPTANEVGVLNGTVSPGDVVAIVGAGPVGLAALVCARLHTPSTVIVLDLDDGRLQQATRFGADVIVNNKKVDPLTLLKEYNDGLGVDVAIEAVGLATTFELAVSLVRPGGHVANIGVHGASAVLHLETLWSRDVTITTGLVDAYSTPTLLRLVAGGHLDAGPFISHTFNLEQMLEAYDVFERAGATGALKVVLTA